MSGFLSTSGEKFSIHRTPGSRGYVEPHQRSGGEKGKPKEVHQRAESSVKSTKRSEPNPPIAMSSSPLSDIYPPSRKRQRLLQQPEEEEEEFPNLTTPSQHRKHHRHDDGPDHGTQSREQENRDSESLNDISTSNPATRRRLTTESTPRNSSLRESTEDDEVEALIRVRSSSSS